MVYSNTCKKNRNEVSGSQAGALYIHVPFCAAKCRYCDFYSLATGQSEAGKFLWALAAEMRSQAPRLRNPLASVFVGGGTPTSIGQAGLEELLAIPADWIGCDTEFSVEANPGTVDGQGVETLIRAGVNRVNLGVQSFRADELKNLGRIHSPQQARDAFNMLRQAGLQNIGLDLIYGIPGQSLQSWRASVAEALDLGPQHLSCYGLTFEDNTPLWKDLQAGLVEEMDEAEQEACWRHAISAAADAGLEHYEISNFAKGGRQCRHNLTYWQNMPYIGLGPGAASYLGGVRRTNDPDLAAYVRALLSGQAAPASQEQLTGRRAMAETVMLALRLTQGLDLQAFEDRYGQDVRQVFPRNISRYIQTGALEVQARHLRIPASALFVSNEILADILAEA
jgi:oxygen-independent coproporphyrinogen-3 oxidase